MFFLDFNYPVRGVVICIADILQKCLLTTDNLQQVARLDLFQGLGNEKNRLRGPEAAYI